MSIWRGGLFSDYFLTRGVEDLPEWRALDADTVAAAQARLAELVAAMVARARVSEADTENDLIEPVIEMLGWTSRASQVNLSRGGRADVPDYLLYLDAAAKVRADATPIPADKYQHGATILEGKAWGVPLDRGTGALGEGVPSSQMLRYLNNVDVQSKGAIRFGVLTNGKQWRLYDNKARSRIDGYLEIDLDAAAGDNLLANADERIHAIKLLLLFFGRDGFAADMFGRTLHERALGESRRYEETVTKQLGEVVFGSLFLDLAAALAVNDPARAATSAYLAELREATLTYLYRLLFVLYAEDRHLLPTHARPDGLKATREAIATALDSRTGLSTVRDNFDGDLRALWRQIDGGDPGIRLPPYNGGLFAADRAPLLERARIPDAAFAPILDALSRTDLPLDRRWINYRDLSVQHLGSIYERLLEYDLMFRADGEVEKHPHAFARKTSGSYYTPEELVMLVIRRTVGPLLAERREAFDTASARLASDKRPKAERLAELAKADPAAAFLDLKVCDPAMGSGHFLVSLVDYLADEVLRAMADAAATAGWGDAPYVSPLAGRLADIRARILAQAAANGWEVREDQLNDRQLVRRMILKRVIYGVDKNAMAVELAKLSLWLHSFTVGAPLSFLDHHLRCGDSLFGEWVGPAMDRLQRGGLLARDLLRRTEAVVGSMQEIEGLTDADIVEVHQSEDAFKAMQAETKPLRDALDLLQGYRWVEDAAWIALKRATRMKKLAGVTAVSDPVAAAAMMDEVRLLERRAMAFDSLLDGEFGPPETAIDVFYGRVGDADPAVDQLATAVEVAAVNGFLHWEIEFLGVWRNWTSRAPEGGFNAIIGNPPWDRLKLQEVEWFAARAPEIARQQRAADRKRMAARLIADGDPLAVDYQRAARSAEQAARMANLDTDDGGQFPLLGKGDVNLYSLFVERAARLTKPNGLVGLLVPSGIAADLGASAFFRSVSTTGRLGSLLDFENRGVFFPDVHRSFKFCALVFGGKARTFAAAECGFFLSDTGDNALSASTFALGPADFAAVNPNTGTAPIFRTRRDAELTKAIYDRVPVLVDKRGAKPRATWPVRYVRMFDMTNDSGLFRTRAELDADGWYPVAGNRLKKGAAEMVPLYEGKMVQAFDHRAASVTVNPENLHRPAQPEATDLSQHQAAGWSPTPQFYVSDDDLPDYGLPGYALGFKEITAPTNMRTFIAVLMPAVAFGNKTPLLVPTGGEYRDTAVPLVANFNTFVFDFVARQKVHGQTLNWFLVEQLPVLLPAAYDRTFGALTARELVRREILRLTYTAHDMAAFARDMGHVDPATGDVLPPFAWDEDDRAHRRARLDALYFHLYGIGEDDADYILSTFPIVRREDEAAHRRFVTRDRILAYMRALAAGDVDTVVAI